MVRSRKWVTPPLPPGLVESTFSLSSDSPLAVDSGANAVKQRKPEHGEHAVDTYNHTSDRLQLHAVWKKSC